MTSGPAPTIDLEEVAFLLSCGESLPSIAHRLGVAVGSIERATLRRGTDDERRIVKAAIRPLGRATRRAT